MCVACGCGCLDLVPCARSLEIDLKGKIRFSAQHPACFTLLRTRSSQGRRKRCLRKACTNAHENMLALTSVGSRTPQVQGTRRIPRSSRHTAGVAVFGLANHSSCPDRGMILGLGGYHFHISFRYQSRVLAMTHPLQRLKDCRCTFAGWIHTRVSSV